MSTGFHPLTKDMSMKRFEYMTLNIAAGIWNGKIEEEELTNKLNELGRAGWELVSTTNWNSTNELIMILKREL